jgi:hypothetical protein
MGKSVKKNAPPALSGCLKRQAARTADYTAFCRRRSFQAACIRQKQPESPARSRTTGK